MGLAGASPTTVGLYINSFGIDASDTSPYTNLLGTDGFGNNPAGGNKIDDLITYMVHYDYNYAILYGTSSGDFVNSPGEGAAAEQFSTQGQTILENVIPRFKAFGIDVGVVCDVFRPNTITHRYDGTSQVRKIHKYNTDVAFDPSLVIDWVNFETEFWNFPYTNYRASFNTGGTKFDVLNVSTGELQKSTSCVSPALVLGSATIGDFVAFTGPSGFTYYRQITSLSALSPWTFDRQWDASQVPNSCNTTIKVIDPQSTVDFETFLVRLMACTDYIAAQSSALKTEIYVGFPDYIIGGQTVTSQLARLYTQGNTDRLLLTNYPPTSVRSTPDWTNINWPYSGSGGAYHRVTDDIIPNIDSLRQMGVIVSVESATFNNQNGCPSGENLDFNFAGYFMEGRSVVGGTGNQIFAPINSAGVAVTAGGGCRAAGTLFAPPLGTYDPRSLQDTWDYIVADPPPSGAGFAPYVAKTFNEAVNDGDFSATNLNFDTLIIFDQEFMRQLVTDPPITTAPLFLSYSIENVTCNSFCDGVVTVNPFGGTQPYSFTWEVFDVGTASWVPYSGPGDTTDQITSVCAGDYRCTLDDSAASTPYTTPTLTVTEPAIINAVIDAVNANCSGTGGSIDVISASGGASSVYSCSIDSGTTTFPVPHTFTPLIAGPYTVEVYSGSPSSGCFLTANYTLTENSPPVITSTPTGPTCSGGQDGSILVTISTPTLEPYTYTVLVDNGSGGTTPLVFTGNSTSHTFSNIPWPSTVIGNLAYSVSVVDGNGCTSNTDSDSLVNPSPITVSTVPTEPDCYGGLNGSLEATATGGTGGPYAYVWSNGFSETGTTSTLVNVGAGTYTVIAYDANNCSGSGSGTITQPTQVLATYAVTQISPSSGTLGSITLQAITGGTSPYTYLWSTGATTESITDLNTGTYTVTVTDANGCTSSYTFILYNECPQFTLTEFKVALFKAQCCSATLAKRYLSYTKSGRIDLAKRIQDDLKFLTLVIDSLTCITPGDEICLVCEDVQTLLEQITRICGCDCCNEVAEFKVPVDYNPETGEFDSQE